MGRIFCRIVMTLCCTILLAASVQAKTLKEVYLKDGGIIKCQNVWQANGKVKVLVNHELLVDLSRSEVDLEKTFGKKPAKSAKKMKAGKKGAFKPAAIEPETIPQPPAKPVVPPAAEQKPETRLKPEAKPAPPIAKPVAPAVKNATPTPKQPASKEIKPSSPAAKHPPAEPVKPAPPAPKQQAESASKPAAPAAANAPPAAKPAVQHPTTSAKKPTTGAAATKPEAPRSNLPLAKPATPPEEKKSFLSGNMKNFALAGLLLLLVIGYVVYKKKQ